MSIVNGGIVSVGGGSSGGSGSSSGIQTINPGGNTGPDVTFTGVNGIEVTSPSVNVILIDGAGASGTSGGATKYAESFAGITSGQFVHGLNSLDVIVQVRDAAFGGGRVIIPDDIIIDSADFISLIFNVPTTGRVVII